ncbi:hypothetical protein YC2023_091385 [Brassica napus]
MNCTWMVRIAFFIVIISAEASIHEYKNQSFTSELNGRYFQGGSECLYASNTFSCYTCLWSSKFVHLDAESVGKQNVMQSATVLVEAIILEGKDRDRIGSTTDLDPNSLEELYGYLRGKVAPFKEFFGFMSLCYLLLGLTWFLMLVKDIGDCNARYSIFHTEHSLQVLSIITSETVYSRYNRHDPQSDSSSLFEL